jgi:hypothetical protein
MKIRPSLGQVEDLLFFFQSLGGVTKARNHLFDRFLEAVEVAERRINAHHLVAEDARQPGVVPGVDHLRLADGGEHPFGCRCVDQRITFARIEVLLERHFLFTRLLVTGQKIPNDIHGTSFKNGRCIVATNSHFRFTLAHLASTVEALACRWKSDFTVGER